MNTYTKEQLKDILDQHNLWLQDNSKGKRANLSNADLSNADLSYATLSNADLSYANLFNANLSYADLSYATLYNANLYNANLINSLFSLSSSNMHSLAEFFKNYLENYNKNLKK